MVKVYYNLFYFMYFVDNFEIRLFLNLNLNLFKFLNFSFNFKFLLFISFIEV